MDIYFPFPRCSSQHIPDPFLSMSFSIAYWVHTQTHAFVRLLLLLCRISFRENNQDCVHPEGLADLLSG